jgi:hypothetical protein
MFPYAIASMPEPWIIDEGMLICVAKCAVVESILLVRIRLKLAEIQGHLISFTSQVTSASLKLINASTEARSIKNYLLGGSPSAENEKIKML